MQSVKMFNRRDIDELVLLDIAATPAGPGGDIDIVAPLEAKAHLAAAGIAVHGHLRG